MHFLTLEEVLTIHQDIMERFGGIAAGVRTTGPVEAALYRAEWGPFEVDDLEARAGFILRGICQDHPFVDGNKRTAFAATEVFLQRNGKYLEAAAEAVVAFMLAVADGTCNVEEICAWLRTHARYL